MKKYLLFIVAAIAFLFNPRLDYAQEKTNTMTVVPWGERDMVYKGKNYDVLDSNYVPKYRRGQFHKFMGHEYLFPPKPRSMWEIGFGAGSYNILGDVPSTIMWQKNGSYALHLQVRKAWGYTFSTRLQYMYSMARGIDYSTTYPSSDPAWAAYSPTTSSVVHNYMTESHQLNLDLMFNIMNINFHKASTGIVFYGYVGLGVLAFNTRVNALDANGKPYDFAAIIGSTPQTYANRDAIIDKLNAAMDNSYETAGENQRRTKSTIFGNKTFDWVPSIGVGAQVKLSPRMNLQFEDRISAPDNEDLMDGSRWANSTLPQLSINNDLANYFSIGLNFNIGNKHKSVQPLYWINPLDYAYSELSRPRHMILPDAVLTDSDNDGVVDQMDKCPNTPAGVRVDAHGCPMDTDGDGVPDYLDKQLITPSECQPVDKDGVGKCPCPDACKTAPVQMIESCNNIGSGSLVFAKNSVTLSKSMEGDLADLAAQMRANPTCKVTVSGIGNASKIEEQRSWDRVNAVVQYLTDKKFISRNRFVFQYGQAGEPNRVEYHAAVNGEDGASNVAPPFPNLRK